MLHPLNAASRLLDGMTPLDTHPCLGVPVLQMLAEKRVALGKAPPGRFCEPFEDGFDLTMGLLDNIFAFDHRFFKTSGAEEYRDARLQPTCQCCCDVYSILCKDGCCVAAQQL